jgi:hypothetical protein
MEATATLQQLALATLTYHYYYICNMFLPLMLLIIMFKIT